MADSRKHSRIARDLEIVALDRHDGRIRGGASNFVGATPAFAFGFGAAGPAFPFGFGAAGPAFAFGFGAAGPAFAFGFGAAGAAAGAARADDYDDPAASATT